MHGTCLRFWQKCLFQTESFFSCSFLANGLQVSLKHPVLIDTLNIRWNQLSLGCHEDGSTKTKAWIFCVCQTGNIYTAYMPTYEIICFCFIMLPLAPIFILLQTKSFIFENFPYCQNHFGIWHLCCSWAVYVILIAEPPPRSGLLLSQNLFDIFPFSPYLLSSHSFLFILCISFWPVFSACVYVWFWVEKWRKIVAARATAPLLCNISLLSGWKYSWTTNNNAHLALDGEGVVPVLAADHLTMMMKIMMTMMAIKIMMLLLKRATSPNTTYGSSSPSSHSSPPILEI